MSNINLWQCRLDLRPSLYLYRLILHPSLYLHRHRHQARFTSEWRIDTLGQIRLLSHLLKACQVSHQISFRYLLLWLQEVLFLHLSTLLHMASCFLQQEHLHTSPLHFLTIMQTGSLLLDHNHQCT